ncbi:hypothetical protein [Rhodoferax saidenbachensis]|uniref:DUF883 domain-containing protein n=1 Tax=Rhodoferax saidenbachensis TaxID=1484693 RepID=A0A1P8KAH7_9BURK|nr:hypothetical protein [Rhodoferax saidenbachensis]APW42983.1 hypothetical protein RS694_10865 [Rhodoferax saidenbachensis]
MKNEPNLHTNNGSVAANQIAPLLDRATEQAGALAQRGLHAVQDSAQQLREKAAHSGEVTVRYIQSDPVKAVLIAAATGAALMALISLASRSRHH